MMRWLWFVMVPGTLPAAAIDAVLAVSWLATDSPGVCLVNCSLAVLNLYSFNMQRRGYEA